MSEFFIANVSLGKLNAMVKNLSSQLGETDPNEVVRLVNAGSVQVERLLSKWTEENGVITFELTNNGWTGEEWITSLEASGHDLNYYAKQLLRSEDFKPSPAGDTLTIKVLKGELFSDEERRTDNIRAEANRREYQVSNAEIACLIREKFSNAELKKMGLYGIVAMHEPINDSDGDPSLLGANRHGDDSWLRADCGRPDFQWRRGRGFAFVGSQVSAES
jgi:hypothetical protein